MLRSDLKARFLQRRSTRWSLRILLALVFVAVFGDFIANEKPLYCQLEGKTYFPVLHSYAVGMGLGKWEARFVQEDWQQHKYERVIYPPIPYSASTIDRRNMRALGPGDRQNTSSARFRHWLGTDELGRDVLAGLINGTRIALLVGIISMSIASLIGITLGAVAGYFGNHTYQLGRGHLIMYLLAIPLVLFYGFISRSFAYSEGDFGWETGKSLLISLFIFGLAALAGRLLDYFSFLKKKITLPLDSLIMRLIEIMNSIPALLLLLAVVAAIKRPNILYVMAIIGFIRWTGIARFMRAEMLRIRESGYIEAAQALGYSNRRIIWRHALPNGTGPVLVAIAFGVAGAILLEAFLSFLGIGLPADMVTWGTMLNKIKARPDAWWLATFPGLAIFISVTIFNLLGEGLREALGRS